MLDTPVIPAAADPLSAARRTIIAWDAARARARARGPQLTPLGTATAGHVVPEAAPDPIPELPEYAMLRATFALVEVLPGLLDGFEQMRDRLERLEVPMGALARFIVNADPFHHAQEDCPIAYEAAYQQLEECCQRLLDAWVEDTNVEEYNEGGDGRG